MQRQRKLAIGGLACLSWIATPVSSHADSVDSADGPPAVALEKLLTLPPTMQIDVERYGGATRSEWRSRFDAAFEAVGKSQQDLDASLAKLNEMVAGGNNWKVSAPGSVAQVDDTSPINYGLKQEIRRGREEVERAEKDLVSLKVEANLAGVPAEWVAEWDDGPAAPR